MDPTAKDLTQAAGVIKIAGAGAEAIGAAAMALTPEPTMGTKVGAGLLGAHAADTFQAGVQMAWTGQPTKTGTSKTIAWGATKFGASEQTASTIGEVGDALAPVVITLGANMKSGGNSAYDEPVFTPVKETKIPTINGQKPINSGLAGQTHPSGVQFKTNGFPDFKPYAKAEVKLGGLTGNYAKDAAVANQAVGLKQTPEGYVWHHVEDGKTMQLIPQAIHDATGHTGGSAVIKNGGFD